MSEPDTSDEALQQRIDLAQCWEEAAPGWIRHRELLRAFSEPVSRWLIEALAPAPGQRLLELAAGTAETGLLAAELVGPEGEVIISDQSERMLAGARERAAELGASNVTFKRMDAEWIDLPVASLDGIIFRWALMLLVDPSASVTEMRRVLRPGGRVALAVWDTPARNPWLVLSTQVLQEQGIVEFVPRRGEDGLPESAPPGQEQGLAESAQNGGTVGPADAAQPQFSPGPFALADGARLTELLELSGFTEVVLDALDLTYHVPSFEAFWETRLDLSSTFHGAVMGLPESEIAHAREAVKAALAPYLQADGSLAVPARTLLASASA